jgi:photosystem II stability/assembly factor-like uncharacterized protein
MVKRLGVGHLGNIHTLESETSMTLLHRRSLRWVGSTSLTMGLLALLALPVSSDAQPKPRDQQIAEVEKQIAELTKKLNALRATPVAVPAPPNGTIPQEWIKTFHWRSIGPAAMGGRIVALSVYEADPCIYWVATASGGLLKTINSGTTFEHQLDRESTVSIGDVCVAPSNPNIVWIGTGENNPRNSVSYGDGVYKSVDGGKTWTNMGLKKTFQVGRVIVHPKNPDVVYVGALGRLYGPSKERGLYKTTDGGKTWQQVLFIDDKTGVIDMQMSPADPETLLVATWERQRDGFDSHRGEPAPADGYDAYDPIKKWGPGSGLHKTVDGGKTFKKITAGLPTGMLGRMGLDYYRKDPKTVFLIVDTEKIGMGPPPNPIYLGIRGEDAKNGAVLVQVTPNSPAAKADLKEKDVIVAFDGKPVKKYAEITERILTHKAGDKVAVKIQRGQETKDIVVTLENRPQPPASAAQAFLGIAGEAGSGGVRLAQVIADGPAFKAGLRVGDLVVAVEKTKVTTFPQLVQQMQGKKPGDKITFQVLQGNEAKAIVVTLAARPAPPRPTRPYSFWYGGQRENVQKQQGKDGFQYGGVYKSTDGGESWTRINSVNPRPMYFSQVRVDPSDDKFVYVCGIFMYRSKDGGQTFTPDNRYQVHPDQHSLWINPRDGRHMIVGCDGGFYVTHDRMEHWDFLNHLAIGQFYHVTVDNKHPYCVYGGLQDNGSWGGPSRGLNGRGPINEDWVVVNGGDGFVCRVDPNDSDLVYFETQDGNTGRRHLKNGSYRRIAPKGGGYRFNWNTPFILSSHNPRIYYSAGNHVFRSVSRGDDLRVISPEISLTKRGTATALAESPRNPDVLYVGTDDGALWVTRDGGKLWTNITKSLGLPGPRWVASIESSRYADGRAYVVFDAHRSDDDEPYVYVTEDFGQTWKSLRANLPGGSTRVLREDIQKENLLYLGTEFSVWASLNRGGSWTRTNNNLPTVAVHEFAQHPTAGEMVAATHGRSLWILDVAPLRQMSPEVLTAKVYLFEPNRVIRWRTEPARGSPYGVGSRLFVGENPPAGAPIYYALAQKAPKLSLKVLDYTGKMVADVKAPLEPGLHRVSWNMLAIVPPITTGPRKRAGGFRIAAPGMYRVVLNVDGKEFTHGLRIEADPTLPSDLIAAEGEGMPPKKKKLVPDD